MTTLYLVFIVKLGDKKLSEKTLKKLQKIKDLLNVMVKLGEEIIGIKIEIKKLKREQKEILKEISWAN